MSRLLLLPLALLAVNALAEETAGMVKVAKGAVTLERKGGWVDATVGAPVLVSDRIRTGSHGAVGITLRDNTSIAAGPNSLLVMEKFAFDASSQKGLIDVNISRGTISVVSGMLAKSSPESVVFRTPSSLVGLRGTEFVVDVRGR